MSRNLPSTAHLHVREALAILIKVGMPSGQQNERTALVLLALAGVKKGSSWTEITGGVRLGITEMMDWMRAEYGKIYAPNSRETVRRFSVHQMIDAGLIQQNDKGALAINSPDNRYCLSIEFVSVLRTFGTSGWAAALETFKSHHRALAERYAREREMTMIPVVILTAAGPKEVRLSAGGQNPVIKAVIEAFAPRFTPGAIVAYIGDTGEKHIHHDRELLETIGIRTDEHGKMPDVIFVHQRSATERWLVLVEAVTSHGPMNPKRISELETLFAGSTIGKVFITAFPDQTTMAKYAKEIAWETEAWIADNPTHLIHFNGDRFLGPHRATS